MFSGYRLSDFYIDVSQEPDESSPQQCAYDSVPYADSQTRVYTCPLMFYGRYVGIRFTGAKAEHLQLCEVQVQGYSKFTKSKV